MVNQPDLTSGQRMALARISGAAQLLSIGRERDMRRDWAVARLHGISTDPAVLGAALGDVLRRIEVESPTYAVTAELLRAAGADEDVAAARLAWQRERAARNDGGFRL